MLRFLNKCLIISWLFVAATSFAETEPSKAELYNEYNEASKKEIEKAIELKASKEDIAALKSELSDTMTKQFVALQKVLKDQGVLMKRLTSEEVSEKQVTVKDKVLENKEAIYKLAKGESRENVRFTVTKADMTLGTNTTGQIPQADRNPMIGDVKERMITLLDIVTTGSIGSNVKEWVYVSSESGAAASTAEAPCGIVQALTSSSPTVKKDCNPSSS